MLNKYTYRVEWSEEDEAFVSRCLEFPSLAAHGKTQEAALKEIVGVVDHTLKDMKASGEEIPKPLGLQKFKGNITLRVPPEVHKELVIESREADVSLNQLLLTKIRK